MKIAFFSDNFYPELSGITDTILITGKELTKRGHEVCYVGPRYTEENYKASRRPFPKNFEEDKVDGMQAVRLPSFHIPSPTGNSRFAIPNGSSFAFLDTFKPDLIHTQSPYGVGREAVKAARRYGIPLIGTNHTAIEDFYPLGLQTIMRLWDAHYYNHCSFVTTPYAKLLLRMRERGFKREGQAMRNPAKLNEFVALAPQEKAALKAREGLDGPVVLYVGRLGVEKRVDVIVRALPALIKEFPKLTFIATGHGAAEPGLRALAKKLGVLEHIRFVGFVEPADLAVLYQQADAFAFMSTSDSQSLSLVQGYAAALPAACARARGLPDYTPEDCGFLIEPGDHKTLAEKLALLLRDDALRARMGAAGVEYSKGFSPEGVAAEWEGIYMHALESR